MSKSHIIESQYLRAPELMLDSRKINEFEAYRTLGLISASSGLGHIMYLVRNSDYMNWFYSEGMGAREMEKLLHFCVVTYSSIIDVISLEYPTFNGEKLVMSI